MKPASKILYLGVPLYLVLLIKLVSSRSSCRFGQFSGPNGECIECLSTCSKCKGYLSECDNCSQGEKLHQGECKPCGQGVLFCDNPNMIQCQPHYSLEKTMCKPKCISQYCLKCSSIFTNECEQCSEGFSLNQKNKCRPKNRILLKDSDIQHYKQILRQVDFDFDFSPISLDGLLPTDSKVISTKSLSTISIFQPKEKLSNNKSYQTKDEPRNDPPEQESRPDLHFEEQEQQHHCLIGWFLDNQICNKCEVQCSTCINSADQCLQCKNGWTKVGWKCVRDSRFSFSVEFKSSFSNEQSKESTQSQLETSLQKWRLHLLREAIPMHSKIKLNAFMTYTSLNFDNIQKKVKVTGFIELITAENTTSVALSEGIIKEMQMKKKFDSLSLEKWIIGKNSSERMQNKKEEKKIPEEEIISEKANIGGILAGYILGVLGLVLLIFQCVRWAKRVLYGKDLKIQSRLDLSPIQENNIESVTSSQREDKSILRGHKLKLKEQANLRKNQVEVDNPVIHILQERYYEQKTGMSVEREAQNETV